MNAIGCDTAWKMLDDHFGLGKAVDRDRRHDHPSDASGDGCRIDCLTIRIKFHGIEMAVGINQHC